MLRDADALLRRIRAIHAAIRDAVVDGCERAGGQLDSMAAVVGREGGDTVFAIDRVSEEVLVHHFDDLARTWPMLLIAEGLGEDGRRLLTHGASPQITVIVDPIDGTRGLMYQKRPGWILTGVAPYRGDAARLSEIELAVQTEIPLIKQHLCDSLWTGTSPHIGGERLNRLTGERVPLAPQPSRATTIGHGFGNLSRFFPGTRALVAEIDDALVQRVLGDVSEDRAASFEDQYISTGGQFFELMMGHDRWSGDLRPLVWAKRGRTGLSVHPYDVGTELIARRAGIVITGADGAALDVPLDVNTGVTWFGYANAAIRAQVEPVLQQLLREFRLR